MIEKTKEEIILEHTPSSEYPSWYHESDIEEMMTKFADQEKRSTAIAFLKFIDGAGLNAYADGKGFEELYDLYLTHLQSLPKTV